MKANKKFLKVVSAMTLAAAMSFSVLGLDSLAAGVSFNKVDSDSNSPVAGAKIDFFNATGSKLFTITTNANGKASRTVSTTNSSYRNVVDENGNLNLKDGDYIYKEVQAPSGYMLNTAVNKLYVLNGASTDINLLNTKFKNNKGQLVIKSINKKGEGVGSATLDLFKANSNKVYELIATFTTDEDGNLMSAFNSISSASSSIEVVNGSLSLDPGNYKVEEKNVNSPYTKISNPQFATVKNKQTATISMIHAQGNSSGSGSSGSNSTNEEVKTGLRLRYVQSSNRSTGIKDVAVSVYKAKSDKTKDTKIFTGKTGSDGYLDLSGVSEGSEYLKASKNGNVLELDPGNYIFKLDGVANAKEHFVTVVDGKITSRVIVATSSSSSKNSASNKKASSSGATLAKTGISSESQILVASIGSIFMAAGVYLLKR